MMVYSANEVVRIIAGPFAGLTATVVESRSGKTRVEAEFFGGRHVPLSIDTAGLAAADAD